MTAKLDVQKALKSTMEADTGAGGLMAPGNLLVSGVHDYVPSTTLPPYIVVGDSTERPYRTFGRDGYVVTATVVVHSESAQGYEPALLALARMRALLDPAPGQGLSTALAAALTALGWTLVDCRYKDAPGVRGQDGEVRAINAVFEVTVQD